MDSKEITKEYRFLERDLTSDTKSIYINQYALFLGFPMTHGQLKDWQNICIMYGKFQGGF